MPRSPALRDRLNQSEKVPPSRVRYVFMILSVVIPTYNRGPRLVETVAGVLNSSTDTLDEIEVIVVDDGSQIPAQQYLEQQEVHAPFRLQMIRQSNGGPAKARNAGFRAARGKIVLFMDDDILPPPNLLRQHVEAHVAH